MAGEPKLVKVVHVNVVVALLRRDDAEPFVDTEM